MVKERCLNRINIVSPRISAPFPCLSDAERGYPAGFRVNRERRGRERDPIRNATTAFVQSHDPGLPGERAWQRQFAKLDQEKGQGTAEQRGVNQIIEQIVEAEP